jgi:TonB family protein
MAHAVSASFLRSERMSPPALALAVLLHLLVILGLWGASHLKPAPSQFEDAIEVSIEQPKPPEPPPPEQKPQPPLPPVTRMGLSPPSPNISDRPTQVPQAPPSTAPPAPAPPPMVEATPPSLLQSPPPTPPTPPEPKPQPTSPNAMAALAPPTPPPPKPAVPTPPRAQPQRPELKPSPLSTAPQRRPPAAAPAEPPSPHPFVNPADTYSHARVADNYLWQVISKLIGYRYEAHVSARQGRTVVRVVIARDGRLLSASVLQSSGVPEFDRGVLAGVHEGSPYAPLPDNIKGASASFDLPLVSYKGQ